MSGFYRTSIPKSQRPEELPYVLHYPHSIDISHRKWSNDKLSIFSTDPGRTNFAPRFEERFSDGTVKCKILDHHNLNKIVKSLIKENESIAECKIYNLTTDLLEAYYPYFSEVDLIIIERQLPINYKMVRFSQHLISWMCIRLKDIPKLPLIFEIDNKLKTKILNCPKYCDIKRWSVEKALELSQKRKDEYTIQVLTNPKDKIKKEDRADATIQIEAFLTYMNWNWPFPPVQRENISPIEQLLTPSPSSSQSSNSPSQSSSSSNSSTSLNEFLTSGKSKVIKIRPLSSINSSGSNNLPTPLPNCSNFNPNSNSKPNSNSNSKEQNVKGVLKIRLKPRGKESEDSMTQ